MNFRNSFLSKLTLYGRVRENYIANCNEGGGPPAPQLYTFSSFTVSQTEAEVGETISNLVLNWTYTPLLVNPSSQSINQGVGAIGNALRAANTGAVDTTVGSSKTWTISSVFPANSPTANTTINFRRRRYWGVSTNPDIGNAAIDIETPVTPEETIVAGFSNEFATSRQTTKVFNCTGGRYIYMIYPLSLGQISPEWEVNGFPVVLSSGNVRLINLTNASGDTTNYVVQRSDNLLNGAAITVEVL